MKSKLMIITYEKEEGTIHNEGYDNPPFSFIPEQMITLAIGVLSERNIDYKEVLELSVLEIIYSKSENGLKSLKDYANSTYEVTNVPEDTSPLSIKTILD